jgi:hypothetical protein
LSWGDLAIEGDVAITTTQSSRLSRDPDLLCILDGAELAIDLFSVDEELGAEKG